MSEDRTLVARLAHRQTWDCDEGTVKLLCECQTRIEFLESKHDELVRVNTVAAQTIADLEAEIERLTEGAIEGYVIAEVAKYRAGSMYEFSTEREWDDDVPAKLLILSPPTQTPGEKT